MFFFFLPFEFFLFKQQNSSCTGGDHVSWHYIVTRLWLYKILKPENTATYPQSSILMVILRGQMIGYYLYYLKTGVGLREPNRHLEHDMNFIWRNKDKFSLYVVIRILWKHNMALVSACAYVDMNIIYTEQGGKPYTRLWPQWKNWPLQRIIHMCNPSS